MNNPFKTIGIAFIISIAGLLSIFELPGILMQFEQPEWLLTIGFVILVILSILISTLIRSQKIQQLIRIKSDK